MRRWAVLSVTVLASVWLGCGGSEFTQSEGGDASPDGAGGTGGSGVAGSAGTAGTGGTGTGGTAGTGGTGVAGAAGTGGASGSAGTAGTGGAAGTAGTAGAAGTGTCGPGEKLCNGTCVGNDIPEFGCGAPNCDPCHMPQVAAFYCDAGKCEIEQCDDLWADCDQQPGNGCEKSLTTLMDCGGCHQTCVAPTNGTANCDSGVCELTCETGLAVCDDICVDLTSDRNHCGTCNTQCTASIPNGTAVCKNSSCTVACNGTLELCGNSECVDTSSSVTNCGSCGVVCSASGNGTALCSDGACVTNCSPGYVLCEGQCVMIGESIDHCFGCNQPCVAPDNATASCSGGNCSFTCETGFNNCDGTGCTSIASDAKNCGWCGHDCIDADCVGGYCTPTVYASGAGVPSDIAVDPGQGNTGDVYWSIKGDGTNGAIIHTSKVGGTIVSDRTGLNEVATVAIDAAYVFYGFAGGIVRFSRVGSGPPELFFNAVAPRDLSMDSARIFWADYDGTSSGVYTAAKNNGTVTTLASLSTHLAVTPRPEIGGTLVYFGGRPTVSSQAPRVGHTDKISQNLVWDYYFNDALGTVAINSNALFWSLPALGLVMRVLKDGSSTTVVVDSQPGIEALEVQDEYVAWATNTSNNGKIGAVYPGASRVLAENESSVCALALDDQFVYWVNCVDGGSVKRVAR